MNLKPYQITGRDFLRSRRAAFLFDEMGLGKTAQALSAIPPEAPVIVVCPAIAKTVWEDEAAKWNPGLRVSVLAGRGSFYWPQKGELLVLNYELLPHSVVFAPPSTYLIADEAHYLKTGKSLRTRRFRALARAVEVAGGSVWGLTGTPLLREPPDIWNVLQAAGLAWKAFGTWPRFYAGFGAKPQEIKVAGGLTRTVTVWGTAKPWVADAIRKVALRRTRAEVLQELPGKIRSILRVKVKPGVAKDLADEALALLIAGGIDLEAAVERAMDLGGTAFEKIAATRAALSVLKIQAALDLLESYKDAGRPVVVFSAHRAPVEALGSRPGWSAVLGGDLPVVRATAVSEFQAGKLDGIALTIGTGGTAITLTKAADVIFVDQSWSPMENLQAEDRLCRIGQTSVVQVVVLEADHAVDAAVNRVLARKLEMARSAGV